MKKVVKLNLSHKATNQDDIEQNYSRLIAVNLKNKNFDNFKIKNVIENHIKNIFNDINQLTNDPIIQLLMQIKEPYSLKFEVLKEDYMIDDETLPTIYE